MRRLAIFCTTVFLLTQVLAASPKSDSIVAFTGARTKVVWFEQTASSQELKYFDTNEGTTRSLGTATRFDVFTNFSQDQVRISRSGRWVTVADKSSSLIFDISGSTPNKRTLLDKSTCSYWTVKAFGMDSASGIEYVYTLENFGADQSSNSGTAMYRIPLKTDGSADLANARKVTINSTAKIDGAIAVSQDLKKIACQVPWPDSPAILDVATGRLDIRKNGPACHVNIAPDNSYRFFHLDDDHVGISVFGAAMSTAATYISFGTGSRQNWTPRWTNHPRFLSGNIINDEIGYDLGGDVVLQKLSTNYQSIESKLKIANGFSQDAWISSGYTGGGAVDVRDQRATRNVTTASGSLSVRVVDIRGRLVGGVRGTDAGSVDMNAYTPGVYAILAKGHHSAVVALPK